MYIIKAVFTIFLNSKLQNIKQYFKKKLKILLRSMHSTQVRFKIFYDNLTDFYKIRPLTTQGVDRQGPTTVSRYKLLDRGFNFRYFTSSLSTKSEEYHFIYDHGWKELDGDKFLIVQNPYQVQI